jgi:hypothetical protein
MNRSIRAVGLALVVAGSLAGSALAAGALTISVPTVTGCLANKDATLIKVKLGDSPASPCSAGQTIVHLSGGDITSITVGDGLTGGGTNGDVTIGIDSKFTLPQGCVAGDIVEKTSTGWTCGTDSDTTYTAGTGLRLSADHEFSVDPDHVVINGETCGAGRYVSGIASDGHVTCASLPSAGTVKAYETHLTSHFNLAGTQTVLTLNLPAGTYLLSAAVQMENMDNDSGSVGECSIPGSGNGSTIFDTVANESVALQSVSTGGTVNLVCAETSADIDVDQASLAAIRIDTLN